MIGLKENVIIGKKIPAGTGLVQAEDVLVGSQVEYDKLNNIEEYSSVDSLTDSDNIEGQ